MQIFVKYNYKNIKFNLFNKLFYVKIKFKIAYGDYNCDLLLNDKQQLMKQV